MLLYIVIIFYARRLAMCLLAVSHLGLYNSGGRTCLTKFIVLLIRCDIIIHTFKFTHLKTLTQTKKKKNKNKKK